MVKRWIGAAALLATALLAGAAPASAHGKETAHARLHAKAEKQVAKWERKHEKWHARHDGRIVGVRGPAAPSRADFDRDGIPDARDWDDDNDGIRDDRDRHPRSLFRRSQLARYRTDLDRDGIPNGRDRDIDGDGVPNGRDRAPWNRRVH